MSHEIITLRHGEGEFWNLIGPFAFSRAVRRELEIAMSSDENYIWLIAVQDGDVLGFAALEIDGDTAVFRHAYVVPAHRSDGLYGELLAARMTLARQHAKQAKVSTHGDNVAIFERMGFKTETMRGKWHYMEMTL